jgi:UDP-N-acetylmuramate: L-alanyl-gamma-D-glutamyl-meso-diaminopimelate ligase
MHIHILGICGTFMGGIAAIAKQLGHHVSGSDAHVYPPMSTQLEAQGITLMEGYDALHLQQAKPDLVIIGNALSRGNPAIEYILNNSIPYISAPQWLAEQVLVGRWVLAVSGTHGKTTTTSLLTWILEHAGKQPGFLIGGVPENFGYSARLPLSIPSIGESPLFVIEADEYDSAFFDKRSKFMHYRPRTLILNNLEFDHADIFPDLNAIKKQFQYLIRTVPSNGLLIAPQDDSNLADVISQGCWTPLTYIGTEWRAELVKNDGSVFDVYHLEKAVGTVTWSLLGMHNVHNALAAIAAAHHVGVSPEHAIAAFPSFLNVKRRLEIIGQIRNITVYDDFAHHPTAIQTTLAGLRQHVGKQRILAVIEPGSYTMRTGVHKNALAPALKEADCIFFMRPKNTDWSLENAQVYDNTTDLITAITREARDGDHILIMSNTGFEGLHHKLLDRLTALIQS